MCGRIVQNKKVINPGDKIIVIDQKVMVPKIFGVKLSPDNYFYNARTETWHQKWEPYGWQIVKIPIEGFYEKNHLFERNIMIGGLIRGENCIILTVDADNEVKKWHHRMPLIINLN